MTSKPKKLPHQAPKHGFKSIKHNKILIIALTSILTLLLVFLIIVIANSANSHKTDTKLITSTIISYENISQPTKSPDLVLHVSANDIPSKLYNLYSEEANFLEAEISTETFDSILHQIEPISLEIKNIINNYNKKVSRYINIGLGYTMNTGESLTHIFNDFFFGFNLVVKNTLKLIHTVTELTKTVQLTDYQLQLIRLVVTVKVLKFYLKAKVTLGNQTLRFLSRAYSSLGIDTIGNPKFNKPNVVIKKIFDYVFEDVLKTNDNELFRTIANDKNKLWVVRNIEYIPYYLVVESFDDILLTFELDKNGGVIDTEFWIDLIVESHQGKNKDEYEAIIQKMENKCKVLVELWVTENSEYNLDRMLDVYKDYVEILNKLEEMIKQDSNIKKRRTDFD